MSNEEIISLCQYAENGDQYFITCFGNVTKTIQSCWKIHKQACVLKDEKLVICSKACWQPLHSHFGDCNIKYEDIYISIYARGGNVITMFKMQNAISAGQMASWNYYWAIVYRPFTQFLLLCQFIAPTLQQCTVYLVNVKFKQLRVIKLQAQMFHVVCQ